MLPERKPPSPGDPVAYEEDPSQWAAGLIKSMREPRNCGIASDMYSGFVDEIEKIESQQSSIVIPTSLAPPAPPDDAAALATAELAEDVPMWHDDAPPETGPAP